MGGSKLAAPVPVIPLSAVVRSVRDSSKFAAFVVEDQGGKVVARSHDIEVGETYGNRIGVRQGLHLGDRVMSVGRDHRPGWRARAGDSLKERVGTKHGA